MEHELKVWPEYFISICTGEKTFEIRVNDRGYHVGDTLWLREFEPGPGTYTGRETRHLVTYVTDFAQRAGYVVMALGAPAREREEETNEVDQQTPWGRSEDPIETDTVT